MTGVARGPFATTPTDLGAHWTNRLVSQVSEGLGVACYDTTHCIQVAQNATDVSNDGGATWTWVNSIGGYDIACISTTHCFTLFNNNYECDNNCQSGLPPYHSDILETKDGGKTYQWAVPTSGATAIACPTTTHSIALAGDVGGEEDFSWDWTPKTGWVNPSENPPYNQPPFSVAFSSNPLHCASSTRCFAVDDGGAVWTTGNAGKTWSKTTAQPSGVQADLLHASTQRTASWPAPAASGAPPVARTGRTAGRAGRQ